MRTCMRSLLVVTALLLVAPARFVAAAPSDVEDKFNHAVLHAKVRGVLLDKLGSDALRVNIDLNGSTVRLTGQVHNESTIGLAKQVVTSVDGVKSVQNDLTLKGGVDAKTSGTNDRTDLEDALLESKVKGRLLSEVGKNALDVDVDVAEGVVSLKGRVDSGAIKDTVVRTAKATKGVKKVVSLLTVG